MTDIADLLRRQGETLKRSGKEYEWRNGSEKVTIRGNLFYHQYEGEGGDAIDFVRRFYNLDYPEAMEYLLGGTNGTLKTAQPVTQKPPEPFVLPKRNDKMRRVFAYLLSKRGIDRDVLYTFVRENMIYESAEYHNVVFVGYDKDGKAVHANMRGTGGESTFKGNAPNGIPEYSFHRTGTDDTLYLFEAPIDMLSYISLHKDGWKQHSYAAGCGVSDRVLFQMLIDNPNLERIYLCLDSDDAGQKAANRISDRMRFSGLKTEILIPIHKDWNEDLLLKESEVAQCPALQL